MKTIILNYYLRKEIQEAIVEIAKDREVQAWFGEFRGKRPDAIHFCGDIAELAKRGMTSLHISEERWKNPLQLKTGMSKKELDELRKGWDFVLDLDSKKLEHSKIAAELILGALSFHNVDPVFLKFSGNRGFHIAVPFEAFPDKICKEEIKYLFPDGPRIIISYLKSLIQEPLSEKLGIKNPFSLVDIDTVLVSSRHLFRAPYSFNEKTGLISTPLEIDKFNSFSPENAKPEKVKIVDYLHRNVKKNSAKELMVQAFDFYSSVNKVKGDVKENVRRETEFKPHCFTSTELFPPCMLNILKGLKSDGRKRSLFILINFLKQAGWNLQQIEELLKAWNVKNYEILREGYILSQLSWHKRKPSNILPPNCSNPLYYKPMGICEPNNICNKVKNPVNYLYFSKNQKKESK